MDKTKHRKAFFALGGLFVVLVLIFSLVQCTQSYSVTFDTDGGNEIPAVSVNKDDTVARPQNPTKNGFTFAYWELDGEEFDFSQPITADIKLKAIWEAITYTVTFDSDGGSSVSGQTVVYGGRLSKPSDPIREGYNFVGWFLNDTEFDFSKVLDSDVELVAKWEVFDPSDEGVVTTETETKNSIIAYKTVRQNDSTLDEGKTSVKQKGQNGEVEITYTVTYKDGVETGRDEVSRKVIKPAVDEIVLVGTKKTGTTNPKPVVTTKTETKTEVVPFKTVEQNDPTLDKGKTAVKQEGKNGVTTITYTVTYTDGKETSRTETGRTVTTEPVDKVVLVGTKVVVKEPVYTFGTHRPANFLLGSPQVVVTVYKDGTAVSANTVYSNTTVLGETNNDQGLLLIDASVIDRVNRAQLANGTFVNVSKGEQ